MGKKILIVDDEPEIRQALTFRLESEGYQVETAKGGKEAIGAVIHAMRHEPYDLIVLDIMLPDVDGLEILDIIRLEEEYRGISLGEGIFIIMLTALKESWMDSFNKGCDDYLSKPYLPQQLLNKIKEAFRTREQVSLSGK